MHIRGDAILEFGNSFFDIKMRGGFQKLHHSTVNLTLYIKRFWSQSAFRLVIGCLKIINLMQQQSFFKHELLGSLKRRLLQKCTRIIDASYYQQLSFQLLNFSIYISSRTSPYVSGQGPFPICLDDFQTQSLWHFPIVYPIESGTF